MLQFAYPWLFLLLPLPLLMHWLAPPHHEPRLAVYVPFMRILARVAGGTSAAGTVIPRRRRMQLAQVVLGWCAVVTAVARPVWLDEPLVRELPMRDMLVALDLSGSMETEDFTDASGATAQRLTAAKQVLDQFLARRDGDRVGLVFFGSAAFLQAPFTDDLDVVRELLDEAQVRMLGPRTVLGDAIGMAIPLFERSEVEERVLIALTDGNDTGSLVPPARAAEIARDNGVRIFTIAMGDPQAAGEQALDEATLQAVAETTGGGYFHADDRAELEAVYAELDRLTPRQVEVQTHRPERDLFHWPLGFAIVLSMLYFGLVELTSIVRRARPGGAVGAAERESA
jgi:Ca-activated chloride channel family protein